MKQFSTVAGINFLTSKFLPLSKNKRQAHQSSINEESLGIDNFIMWDKWDQTACAMGECSGAQKFFCSKVF